MSGSSRQNKFYTTYFSVFKLFGSRKSTRDEEQEDSLRQHCRSWVPNVGSDEGRWTADPCINDKTSAFIARIKATHVLDS
ncbi:hypothetical protein M5689_021785 [Euphorbia peplus]|nr:hypothetical protein M5689_021785 [Euphorbia peplus]